MKKQHLLSDEELASFCSQVSILLHAGIAPIESIRILSSDTEDVGSKELLTSISDSIIAGNSFAESLAETGVFPKYVINTIKLGEQAGSLDDVMDSLADYYERENQIAESIHNAVTYPLVMIVLMLIVIIVLVTKVLPIFNQVFVQLGSEMTGFAASLMRLGNTLNSYSLIFGIVLGIIIVLYIYFVHTTSGKHAGRILMSKLHATRSLYEEIATGRFARGLALALSAGLDTYSGLDMVKELVENERVMAKIDTVKKAIVDDGANLAEGLKAGKMFSNVNNRMVAVGVKSGELDRVLRHISDEYEHKCEKKINSIISVIEPTLVIILSIIVGLILLSVILPLMGIMSTIG